MAHTGWWLMFAGVLFLGFAVYHYFQVKGWSKEAEADRPGSNASKIFAVSHGFRGIGSLIMGLLLIAGGILMVTAG